MGSEGTIGVGMGDPEDDVPPEAEEVTDEARDTPEHHHLGSSRGSICARQKAIQEARGCGGVAVGGLPKGLL